MMRKVDARSLVKAVRDYAVANGWIMKYYDEPGHWRLWGPTGPMAWGGTASTELIAWAEAIKYDGMQVIMGIGE